MDGLGYTTIIEFAEPLARRRWLSFGSLGAPRTLYVKAHHTDSVSWQFRRGADRCVAVPE